MGLLLLYCNEPMLSRFEHLIQIRALRFSGNEFGMLFRFYVKVPVHMATRAKLDLQLTFADVVTN